MEFMHYLMLDCKMFTMAHNCQNNCVLENSQIHSCYFFIFL